MTVPKGMMRFREQATETAGFYNTVGFNDDTRAFLSIPARHDVARRVDCAFLAKLVADTASRKTKRLRWRMSLPTDWSRRHTGSSVHLQPRFPRVALQPSEFYGDKKHVIDARFSEPLAQGMPYPASAGSFAGFCFWLLLLPTSIAASLPTLRNSSKASFLDSTASSTGTSWPRFRRPTPSAWWWPAG